MKNLKLFLPVLALAFIIPGNGCNVLKHKSLRKISEQTKVQNDVAVSKLEVKANSEIDNYKFAKNNTVTKETITYKAPVRDSAEDAIELTASFKIDTGATLKGDTALALTGPGVSLVIVRNPITKNLTATIKKNGSSKKVDVAEIRIDRTITSTSDLADTSKAKLTWSELKLDSLDKSKIESDKQDLAKDKEKKSIPNIWIIVGGIAVVALLIFGASKVFPFR